VAVPPAPKHLARPTAAPVDQAKKIANARRAVLINLIKRYGRQNVRYMLAAFYKGLPNGPLATRFAVTEQRISQWRLALGQRVCVYRLHPEVAQLLQARAPDADPGAAPSEAPGTPHQS
jgi:hypothetical protein